MCVINLFLAEYVLATGDRSLIDSGLKRITKMIVDGQSVVGSWGHGFVQEGTGRLGGYGMMNAPGIPLTYSLVLARQSGVDVPGLDAAIAKSVLLLRFYVGKGSVHHDSPPAGAVCDGQGSSRCGAAAKVHSVSPQAF